MSEINHADREHSELSASSAYRWWNCPASVRLSRGAPRTESAAAAEGTAAHELAQRCLEGGSNAAEYVGWIVSNHEVDADMADAVQVYVDEVRRVWDGNTCSDTRLLETRVRLDALDPPGPMFGTADAGAFVTGHGRLEILDLKFGRGHRVEAEGNPQLRYYALGLMLHVQAKWPGMSVREIRATIVQHRQPAAGRDPIRSVVIDPVELMEWGFDLLEHANATLRDDSPAVGGQWCMFCPAAGRCTAQAEYGLQAARIEFGALVDPDATVAPPVTLSPEQLGNALRKVDALEQMIADMRAAAFRLLSDGVEVPGWKIVMSDGRETWRDPVEAEAVLQTVHEVDPYAEPKLTTPAQVRKRLVDLMTEAAKAAGDKLTKKDAEAGARKILARLTHKPKRAALAPADDARDAISGRAAAEFPALPDETTEQG